MLENHPNRAALWLRARSSSAEIYAIDMTEAGAGQFQPIDQPDQASICRRPNGR